MLQGQKRKRGTAEVKPSEPPLPSRAPVSARQPGSGDILISVVLSIHNRSSLFRRALNGYMRQSIPPEEWEILLLDDLSTEDLSLAYRHLVGKINLRHVFIDHTRHPVFKQRNPGWSLGAPQDWFHTPAITMNAGFHLARGRILCLCHPEVLHAPWNFERATERLSGNTNFLFGTTYLGDRERNRILEAEPDWTRYTWGDLLYRLKAGELPKLLDLDLYWYTSFLPTEAARMVGGVDFGYLHGVAAEDDDFRDRVRQAGWPPLYAPDIVGFHQDHSDETEPHRQRNNERWDRAVLRNREVYRQRREAGMVWPANAGTDWTASECIVRELRYSIGRESPEIIEGMPL